MVVRRLPKSLVGCFGYFRCLYVVCATLWMHLSIKMWTISLKKIKNYSFGNHLIITYSFGKLASWQFGKRHLEKKKTRMNATYDYFFQLPNDQIKVQVVYNSLNIGYNSLQVVFRIWKAALLTLFMKCLLLVLSQICLAVSLVERGKVCAHWWPDMTLFLHHF